MRDDLPSGTVTFLFSDVEGSTKLLHSLGAEAYADALAEHRRVIREACAARGRSGGRHAGRCLLLRVSDSVGSSHGGGCAHRVAGPRPDLRARRPAHGTAARHRRGVCRRRRALRGTSRSIRPRRAGRALGRDTSACRRRCSDGSRRAPPEGHRGSRVDLPTRPEDLPAAQDDLEHEPPAAGELVRRKGAEISAVLAKI